MNYYAQKTNRILREVGIEPRVVRRIYDQIKQAKITNKSRNESLHHYSGAAFKKALVASYGKAAFNAFKNRYLEEAGKVADSATKVIESDLNGKKIRITIEVVGNED